MNLTQSTSMRMDQRQLLTPRMIQSMEILQLPLQALEERIEAELVANPTLELKEREAGDEQMASLAEDRADNREGREALTVNENSADAEEFARLDRIGDYLENEEFSTNGSSNYRVSNGGGDGDRDKKLDAMANSPDRGTNLVDYLLSQWAFVECPPAVHKAGEVLIGYIDGEGYLKTPMEEIQTDHHSRTGQPLSLEDLNAALALVQDLEPAGVGARDLKECLLLQLKAIENDDELSEGHDVELERALIRDHLDDLKMNRYPLIARKLGRDIEDLKDAIKRLSRLHPHPGKQIGRDEAPPITPDARIYLDEETGRYEIEMTHEPARNLAVSALWKKYLKEKSGDRKTREFLTNNVRNAKWLIEAIEQRASTIKRVIRAVVDAQRDFFEKGPEFLRPLPMILVADQLGIHVATVSRAVSEKWIQTPRGVFPLRRFFSGGTTSAEGEDMSWDAVKEKLKVIIAEEDKRNPLNDDEIVDKLKGQGIELARRTVAKYRKILNIATARQRREF